MTSGDETPEPLTEEARVTPLDGTVINRHQVQLPDGRLLDLSGRQPPPGADAVQGRVLGLVQPFRFEVCPICLSGEPKNAEHVPPAAVGGRRLTFTCDGCNHRFGALEAELDLHARNATKGPSFTGRSVQGNRRAREIAISFQLDGSPVFVLDRPDPAIRSMLSAGTLDMSARRANRSLWRTALLKHAYLAACVYLQTIPDSPRADIVRTELLQARAAGADHTIGAVAEGIQTLRMYGQPPAPVYLAAADLDGQKPLMVGLGRYGLVSWPMPDLAETVLARLKAQSFGG